MVTESLACQGSGRDPDGGAGSLREHAVQTIEGRATPGRVRLWMSGLQEPRLMLRSRVWGFGGAEHCVE